MKNFLLFIIIALLFFQTYSQEFNKLQFIHYDEKVILLPTVYYELDESGNETGLFENNEIFEIDVIRRSLHPFKFTNSYGETQWAFLIKVECEGESKILFADDAYLVTHVNKNMKLTDGVIDLLEVQELNTCDEAFCDDPDFMGCEEVSALEICYPPVYFVIKSEYQYVFICETYNHPDFTDCFNIYSDMSGATEVQEVYTEGNSLFIETFTHLQEGSSEDVYEYDVSWIFEY